MIGNPFTTTFLGSILESLDYKQIAWDGHNQHGNASYQYLEGENMKAEEYDQFIYDPTDFIVRTYWPRIFGAFKPFEKLPALNEILSNYLGITKFAAFTSAEMLQALEALAATGRKVQDMLSAAARWAKISRELGCPTQAGAATESPFDCRSDFMRGNRGTMLDIFRRPDKFLAVVEKLYPLILKIRLAAKQRGNPRVFIPLYKGSDGFMSLEQFKAFYWPTLKRLIEELIAHKCVPILFWESDVASRLEIIGDIPKDKVIYAFEQTDIVRAKEVLGHYVCIKGNVPASLMTSGTPDDVARRCQNLIATNGKGGCYILDAATVLDDARPENVKAMFDGVKAFGHA